MRFSLVFSRDLYIKGLRWPNIAKFKLRHGMWQCGYYVIAINTADDQLDIYPVIALKQRYYREKPLFIVAMVESCDDYFEYLGGLLQASYKARGDYHIKEYLLERNPGAREYISKAV